MRLPPSGSFKAGYEDAPHLTREYNRHFGKPPVGILKRLRELETEKCWNRTAMIVLVGRSSKHTDSLRICWLGVQLHPIQSA
ncbi:MAG: hypothetical protein H0X11_00825 [Betaproteobacteria bacterium]|nr:hypothetical protein [Betaproteobacteria bacterium]